MKNTSLLKDKKNEKGIVAVLVPIILLFVLIPVGALAVDLAFLYVARNQLQNAADAGSLAGARVLFNNSGTLEYNMNADDVAEQMALKNTGTGNPSEPDVIAQLGHWSFSSGFTPYINEDLIDPSELYKYITDLNSEESNIEILDKLNGVDYDFFINAVRVDITRDSNATLFSNLLGSNNRTIQADAVAYIGPAGKWDSEEFDYPIAVCQESLKDDFCNIGRMLEDNVDGDTAQWTNFSQPCSTADTTSVRNTLDTCGKGNLDSVEAGQPMGTTNGVVDGILDHPVHASLADCWRTVNDPKIACADDSHENPTVSWPMVLPVINCTDGQPNCREVTGAVNVDVLWVLRDGNKVNRDAPCEMDFNGNTWEYDKDHCSKLYEIADEGGTIQQAVDFLKDPYNEQYYPFFENVIVERWGQSQHEYEEGMARWDCFVNHFKMVSPTGDPAHFAKKTVYFAPDCGRTKMRGLPGGLDFYGVLSEVPVLVK